MLTRHRLPKGGFGNIIDDKDVRTFCSFFSFFLFLKNLAAMSSPSQYNQSRCKTGITNPHWHNRHSCVFRLDDLWNLFQMWKLHDRKKGGSERKRKRKISIRMRIVCFTCRFGEIKLHEGFCAFVNFENAIMAATAMEMLKVSCSIMWNISGSKVSSIFLYFFGQMNFFA